MALRFDSAELISLDFLEQYDTLLTGALKIHSLSFAFLCRIEKHLALSICGCVNCICVFGKVGSLAVSLGQLGKFLLKCLPLLKPESTRFVCGFPKFD